MNANDDCLVREKELGVAGISISWTSMIGDTHQVNCASVHIHLLLYSETI